MSHGDRLSDKEIISDCLKGNVQAYAELVQRHQRMVFNVLYRFLGNYEASQDISQETFITAYRKLDTFNGSSKFSTWLCQIALNKARDLLRGQGVESLCEDLEDQLGMLAGSDSDTPHRRFEMTQENERIQHVLNQMPAHYREILLLKHLEGFSNEEIVDVLKITLENIKVRTFRAREMFKRIYEEMV
ncbi:MAG TPA: sigma-70 family RNA polymerase sigma factor [Burkholderiales bacterium]|nr:sigma-70 family RNA polymerase sigma factor [Burkholderiales bacterium]